MVFYFTLVFFNLHGVGFVMSPRGEFALFGNAVGDNVIS